MERFSEELRRRAMAQPGLLHRYPASERAEIMATAQQVLLQAMAPSLKDQPVAEQYIIARLLPYPPDDAEETMPHPERMVWLRMLMAIAKQRPLFERRLPPPPSDDDDDLSSYGPPLRRAVGGRRPTAMEVDGGGAPLLDLTMPSVERDRCDLFDRYRYVATLGHGQHGIVVRMKPVAGGGGADVAVKLQLTGPVPSPLQHLSGGGGRMQVDGDYTELMINRFLTSMLGRRSVDVVVIPLPFVRLLEWSVCDRQHVVAQLQNVLSSATLIAEHRLMAAAAAGGELVQVVVTEMAAPSLQLYLKLLLMPAGGGGLFTLSGADAMRSLMGQIVASLAFFNRTLHLVHHDLHSRNVLVQSRPPNSSPVYLHYGGDVDVFVPVYRDVARIIDFGYSRMLLARVDGTRYAIGFAGHLRSFEPAIDMHMLACDILAQLFVWLKSQPAEAAASVDPDLVEWLQLLVIAPPLIGYDLFAEWSSILTALEELVVFDGAPANRRWPYSPAATDALRKALIDVRRNALQVQWGKEYATTTPTAALQMPYLSAFRQRPPNGAAAVIEMDERLQLPAGFRAATDGDENTVAAASPSPSPPSKLKPKPRVPLISPSDDERSRSPPLAGTVSYEADDDDSVAAEAANEFAAENI